MNIVLTGIMGSGKTTIGRMAARKLGMGFADTDEMIEREQGRSIADIFASDGQGHFRELERRAMRGVAARDGLVVATGGGVVLSPENLRRLRMNGVIINLQAKPSVLVRRLDGTQKRPLLPPGRKAESVLRRIIGERSGLYRVADFRVDTGNLGKEDSVAEICKIARLPPLRICACVSGDNAETDMRDAARQGATHVELRFDLIPKPSVERLVRASLVPVIATDKRERGGRGDKRDGMKRSILATAVEAGCEFIDVEHDSPTRKEITRLARSTGCKVIASVHDFDGVPDRLPGIGDADLLKVAVMVKSEVDQRRVLELQRRMKNAIIVPMGRAGSSLRVSAPLNGSYLAYCHVGKPTAPGQLSLRTMMRKYREMGLR